MKRINWLKTLGWGENELNDLRYAAFSYIRQGLYDVALTFLESLSVLTSPSPYDLQTIGALHLQIGNGIKALDYLNRALQIDPTHLPTQLNRAKALLMLGYKRDGLAQAVQLTNASDPMIASQASALILSHQ